MRAAVLALPLLAACGTSEMWERAGDIDVELDAEGSARRGLVASIDQRLVGWGAIDESALVVQVEVAAYDGWCGEAACTEAYAVATIEDADGAVLATVEAPLWPGETALLEPTIADPFAGCASRQDCRRAFAVVVEQSEPGAFVTIEAEAYTRFVFDVGHDHRIHNVPRGQIAWQE